MEPDDFCADLAKMMRTFDSCKLPIHYAGLRKMLKNFTKKWNLNTKHHTSPLYHAMIERIERQLNEFERNDVEASEIIKVKV